MPNLHITLGANSLHVEEAPDMNFSPEFLAMLTTFLHRAGGPDPQQDAIDGATERLKGQTTGLEDFIAAHKAP